MKNLQKHWLTVEIQLSARAFQFCIHPRGITVLHTRELSMDFD